MALQENPYERWESERGSADYRSRETQASSFTRQMLKNPEFLLSANRVNPGPLRNSRAKAADLLPQIPHKTLNEDIWGWQAWANKGFYKTSSDFSSNLLEEQDPVQSISVEADQVTIVTDTDMIENITITSKANQYNHVQSIPSSTWTIHHNLGFYPSVELLDSQNREMDGNVIHISVNSLTISLNVPTAGRARLN